MPSITKYPGTLANVLVEKTPHGTDTERPWDNLNNLKADDNVDAVTGASGGVSIASKAGTVSKPARIQGTNFGFNIPINSRIDNVVVEWEEYARNYSGGTTGVILIPSKSVYLLKANGGANTSSRVDSSSVPIQRANKNLIFGIGTFPNMKPVHLNDVGFGVYFNPARNDNYNAGRMYLDYIRARVDYTLPTYALSAIISNQKVLGETVEYSVTLENTNNAHGGINVPVSIDMPSGLSVKSQSGNGTYNVGTGKWSADIQSNGKATLTLILDTTTVGYKTITSTVDDFNINLSKTIQILNPTYTIASNLQATIIQANNATFTITVETNSGAVTTADIEVPIIPGFGFISSNGDGTYNDSTGIWSAAFTNKISTRTFVMAANTAGNKTHTITAGDNTLSKNILVVASNVTDVYTSTIPFNQDLLNYMQDGRTYTIFAFVKATHTGWNEVFEGDKNFKIGIKQGATINLSEQVSELNTYERLKVTFEYDESSTPELILYGMYFELTPANSSLEIAGVDIREGDLIDMEYSQSGILFDNPNLLLSNTDYATITIPSQKYSTPIRLFDLNWAGRETNTKLIVKEIKIIGEIETLEQVGYNFKIRSMGNESTDSGFINPEENSFEVGIKKWGLDKIDLNDFEMVLSFLNIHEADIKLNLKNINGLLTYSYDLTGGNLGIIVDGVHSREYDMFLKPGFDKPEGLNHDVNSLTLERTDGEFILSSTVTSKKYKIPFQVIGNSLEDMTNKLQDITKWLSPERNELQIPIPKELVFEWDMNKKFYYILEDAIDSDYDDGVLECDVEFVFPKGIGWTPLKITGATGRNNGLVSVKPTIKLLKNGGGTITIIEKESGQTLFLNYDFPVGLHNIEIDCDKRRVIDLITGDDLTEFVSWDSDYFQLRGEYNFDDTVGAIVIEVNYQEGV